MQDPLLDPLRRRILARMGIQSWQLRAPTLPGGEPSQAAAKSTVPEQPLPTGKLWLLAPSLPAPGLLADICQCLGIGTNEVSLLGEMPALPEGVTPPLLWLTVADPRWPDALVCPLKPDAAHKRALWQQCRQHLPG